MAIPVGIIRHGVARSLRATELVAASSVTGRGMRIWRILRQEHRSARNGFCRKCVALGNVPVGRRAPRPHSRRCTSAGTSGPHRRRARAPAPARCRPASPRRVITRSIGSPQTPRASASASARMLGREHVGTRAARAPAPGTCAPHRRLRRAAASRARGAGRPARSRGAATALAARRFGKYSRNVVPVSGARSRRSIAPPICWTMP